MVKFFDAESLMMMRMMMIFVAESLMMMIFVAESLMVMVMITWCP